MLLARTRRFALGALLLSVCVAWTAIAQSTPPNLAGTWQGTLPVDGGQRVIVTISKLSGASAEKPAWKAVYYNLEAHAEGGGRVATSILFDGQSLKFAVPSINGSYTAKLAADGASLTGTWTEDKVAAPLTLQRVPPDAAWEIPGADQAMPKDATPEFEVATIKPSRPDAQGYGFHSNGRRIWFDNQTAMSMIKYFYGVSRKQVVGGPDWLNTDRYDADGVPDILGTPSVKQMLGMYQKLMADRFQLSFHREKRELSAYTITVAKTGSKLAPSLGDPNGLPDETGSGDQNGIFIRFTNTSMEDLAAALQTLMPDEDPVVDQTGLPGRFDFTLKWSSDSASPDPSAAPDLFTAIQQQLGLKLERVKTPVDVMVIDHIERPSPN
jgi:uncharacterized protein (TIGR03435 family)